MSAALSQHGYVVEHVSSGARCREMLASNDFDAILIASSLPDGDGADLCRQLRERGVAVPILITIADAGQVADNHEAMRLWNAGADGFIVDPCRDDDLLAARVRVLLRRGRASPADVLCAWPIEMNLASRSVTCHGCTIELRKKEFELLQVLMRNTGRVLTRSAIGTRVWGDYFDTESNVIDVCLHHLRAKLAVAGGDSAIRTVRGIGYMLVAEPGECNRHSRDGTGTAVEGLPPPPT
jgi:DNA-binding response OmpR family regulator